MDDSGYTLTPHHQGPVQAIPTAEAKYKHPTTLLGNVTKRSSDLVDDAVQVDGGAVDHDFNHNPANRPATAPAPTNTPG